MDNTTIEAIRQRLMYSFGFSHEQAQQELAFLFAVPRQKLYTAEFYTMRVRRVGATKILTRQDRGEIYRHVAAIVAGDR
jgi:hypothetical protein